MPQTIRLHRVIKAPPERVYRAFTTPEAMVKWLPPHGFAAQVHEFDARVGGRYRMSFINFSANSQNSFGGEFLNWCRASVYAIPTASRTRICRVK